MVSTFLNTKEAALYVNDKGLPCSPNTLKKLRCVGGGAEFHVWGTRVVYAPEALDAWINERLSSPKRNTVRGKI